MPSISSSANRRFVYQGGAMRSTHVGVKFYFRVLSTFLRSARVQTRALQVLHTGFIVLLACLPVFSQANTGRILGTVLDPTGAAVAGAKVVISDQERGTSRIVTTDESG